MGIKVFEYLRRKQGTTAEQFHAYWRDTHAPMLADNPDLRRHVTRYELNHRLPADSDRDRQEGEFADVGWDGVAVLWFDSVEDMRALGAEPPAQPNLHRAALAGDVATNGLFYALVGTGGGAWLRGALLGSLAGVGAVLLPPVLGLGKWPRGTTRRTKFRTFGTYLAGGLIAAAVSRAIGRARAGYERW